jgi:hypothetical protein
MLGFHTISAQNKTDGAGNARQTRERLALDSGRAEEEVLHDGSVMHAIKDNPIETAEKYKYKYNFLEL